MFRCKLLLILAFGIIISPICHGTNNKYLTYLNEFGGLKSQNTTIDNKYLKLTNKDKTAKFNVIDIDCINKELKYYIRLSNLNNLPNKYYPIIDEKGKTHKVNNPKCGLVWNYIDDNNFCAVFLQGNNTMSFDDILDKRSLRVDVVKYTEGIEDILYSKHFYNCVDLYDGFNVIMLDYDLKQTNIYIGNKELTKLCSLSVVNPINDMKTGYYVGSGADVMVERFVIKLNDNKCANILTPWNKQRLDEHAGLSDDKDIEGFWCYFDRDLNDKSVKLGGKYTIAIVKNDCGGYDIIYYDGAKINGSQWKCGMLKGRLTPTTYIGNYNLVWYDSMMNMISDDCYAQFDDMNIVTMVFPVEKSKIRFIRKK